MLQFENIFKNHFDTDRISDDNLKKFTEKHIQQLTANNGGGTFTVTITDTSNVYVTYFGKLSSEDTAFAIQQGLTITADTIMSNFQKAVSQKEGTIRGLYGKDSAEYQEFFPLGLTEYSNATKANIETLMTRMVNASTAHVADLGAPFVAFFTNFKTNYQNARSAQLLKIGEVDATKTGTETSRNALEVQLLKNLFFVGFNFPGDVTRCMDFFDQNIIRYDSDSATDGFGKATGLIRHNGSPIFDAAFELIGTNIPIAHTNADGRYKTRKTPIGHYQARITSAGLPEQIVELDIVDDGDTNLDLDI
jgi:hypothetical protein